VLQLPALYLFPKSSPALLIVNFVCALFASGAKRTQPRTRMGPAGKILIFGSGCAVFLCLFPHIYILFILLLFPLNKNAVSKEAAHKVSAWSELHHLAAGDSLSWSRQ